ncbi:MAG TPA: glycine--tRNA ligase subunit alpha [Candidatus Hydrothermia bacterium]|nr:glycine--tRNA ligase subunit alpha [Candidatus Hydrothermae bacterium]HRD23482.1 glycine--tRNA ligase subunit alpha [Candidatus Hydrothermia bacterium]
MLTFQDLILKLSRYYADIRCVIGQPYNSEVGAGTFNPLTFLRSLGKKPWKVAYVEITRRPKDSRYAENPNRVQQYHQFQVILKPPPENPQEIYLNSLKYVGIDIEKHDVRFVEDDWESPTLGAWGLGWEVWLDGLEITQFTYFQQVGGIDLEVVPVELTYGLERIAMYIQNVDSIFDLQWAPGVTWGDIYRRFEYEYSVYNYEKSDVKLLTELFRRFEKDAESLLKEGILYPGYDFVIKMSHIFNLLDARGAISASERQAYILKVQRLASLAARIYLEAEGD